MDIREIPQVDIPDEVTQVDMPEIGETTPHPDPAESPVAQEDKAAREEYGYPHATRERIGFVT